MKAVLREVNPQELARRRKLGLDRWDEMWEGVLHMSPTPAYEHQRMQAELITFLMSICKRRRRGTIVGAINIFSESSAKENYRIPDLTFIAAGRERVIAEDGIRGGGPDAVIEIRSPDDETYEKFPFYAALGVREAIVVDRDSKKPEVFRLAGPQYLAIAPDREGWVVSEILGVRFRLLPGEKPRVAVEEREDASTRVEI